LRIDHDFVSGISARLARESSKFEFEEGVMNDKAVQKNSEN